MTRNVYAAIGLAVLSPFVAEFLLGDAFLGGRGPSLIQLPMFLLLGSLYGGAAVLIREFARCTGRGWPTIMVAALAFGVFEDGLLTQSLFNPNYAGQHLLATGYLPALGIGVPWTLFVLTLHTVWSISVPIAIAERTAHTGPWLRRGGLITFGVLLVIGAAVTFAFSFVTGGFLAAPGQLVAAAVLTVLLLVVAFRLPARTARALGGREIPPALLLAGGALVTVVFELVRGADALPAWLLCGLLVVLYLGSAAVIARLATVTAWGSAQAFGLAGGAVLTYCWQGLLTASYSGTGATIEQAVLVVIAVAVVAAIGIRTGAFGARRSAEPVLEG